MPKRQEIIKQAGIYFFATQIAQLITLVAAIVSRRFLGPIQTGIWSTLQIVVDYSKYSSLGTMDAVSREIPYWIGKGEVETAEKIKNLAFGFVLGTSSILALGVIVFGLLTRGMFATEVTFGLFFVSGFILLQRVNNLLIALLRCYKKFETEAGLMIASALLNAILVAVLTYRFKIYGFIWALILSFAFNIIYILSLHRFHFKLDFDFSRLMPLLRYGFPLMLLGALTLLVKSMDKILIAKLLGFQSLGFYSIALMACSYLSNFPIAVAIVFLPHLQEKIADYADIDELKAYLFEAALAYALITPILVGCVWFWGPYLIGLFLPQFVRGIQAMQVLLLSMFSTALTQPFYDFMVGTRKHWFLFALVGINLLVTFALDYSAIHFGFGINGVAFATTLSAFLHFTIVYFFATHPLSFLREAIQKYLSLIWWWVYFAASVLVIHLCVSNMVLSLQRTLLQFFYFLVLSVPFFIVLERRFSILRALREKLLRAL